MSQSDGLPWSIHVLATDYNKWAKPYAYFIENGNGDKVVLYSNILTSQEIQEAYFVAMCDAIEFINLEKNKPTTINICTPHMCFDISGSTNRKLIELKRKMLDLLNNYLFEQLTIDPMMKSILNAEIKANIEKFKDKLTREVVGEVKETNSRLGRFIIWQDRQCGEIIKDTYVSTRYPEHFCRVVEGVMECWTIQKQIVEHLQKQGIGRIVIDYRGKKERKTFITSMDNFLKHATTMCLREEDGDQMFLGQGLWKIINKNKAKPSSNMGLYRF